MDYKEYKRKLKEMVRFFYSCEESVIVISQRFAIEESYARNLIGLKKKTINKYANKSLKINDPCWQ
jgi:hypothetical protein